MAHKNPKTEKRLRLKKKIRNKIFGTGELPRLSVFKSNKFIHAQIIDDRQGVTLASASSKGGTGKGMTEQAKAMGESIAKSASAKGISKVVFDRGGFTYTGVIKTLADSAREAGLSF